DELKFILNDVSDAQAGGTHWIGGYQDRGAPDYSEPAGGWRWVTGGKWDYTNWNGGEPNNYAGGEDFLQGLPSGDLKHRSAPATITGYLVEYEPAIHMLTPTQLSVTPNPVIGGQPAMAQVTLSQAAGAGAVTVLLASSRADVAAVPASVTVPAGQTMAS